jgi:hypothetical protein
MTLSVGGEGNLRNLVLPEVPEIDGLKVYAPEEETNVEPKGLAVVGTRTAKVLLIPKEAGEYTIPPLSWSFFNPETEAYQTLSSKPLKITVRGGESASKASAQSEEPVERVSKAGQDRLNRRLRSITTRADLRQKSVGHPLTQPWFLLIAIVVPLGYLGVLVASRTRQKLAASKLKNRSKNADAEAFKKLHELRRKIKDSSQESFFAELQRALLVFLETRLEEKVVGDTMAELRERLQKRGFTADQAESVIAESEACDFARFARQGTDGDDREQAVQKMDTLIRALSKVSVKPLKKEKRS